MHKLILYIMHTDTQFIDNMYTDTEQVAYYLPIWMLEQWNKIVNIVWVHACTVLA